MGRGRGGAVIDRDVDDAVPCALILSLFTCLCEAGGGSHAAASYIRRAIAESGGSLPCFVAPRLGHGASPAVLASYLEFLLPEVRERSPAAAISIGHAIDALRGAGHGPRRTLRPH